MIPISYTLDNNIDSNQNQPQTFSLLPVAGGRLFSCLLSAVTPGARYGSRQPPNLFPLFFTRRIRTPSASPLIFPSSWKLQVEIVSAM